MKYFIVEIVTKTATFRNPEFQNFHKTLDLPPPTTIIGFAGAALGFSPKTSQEFFDKNIFHFGVYGKSCGKTKDTWKYTNTTKSEELANYHPDYQGSVITKEILFENYFLICFGTENNDAYQELLNSFENPCFALTLGGSDSLAFIKSIRQINEETEFNIIKKCVVEGDVVQEVFSQVTKGSFEFSIYVNSEPTNYDLPTRFVYENDYGTRKVSEVKTFSIIGNEMKLNYNIKGVMFDNIFIPIIKL
jgi:CRISPR-associated protein Cas5t